MDSPLTRSFGRVTAPELAVFVSGVASMGLEILAGRMVAPQFGSSIYTWGSIIGVFLTALSLGYHYGGKRAAEQASVDRLTWLLLGTAAYIAVLVFAGDLLLTAGSVFPLPSRFASLPAIILLFGPPTYLLGFVSPYAAELSNTEDVGEASGRVYALGTVGSILGAFGTTFLLIPTFGIDTIGFLFGLLLVGTAALIVLPSMNRKPLFAVLGVTVLLVAAIGSGAFGVSTGGRVIYQTQTPYQELEVADLGDTRTLFLDGQRHSAMDLSDPNRHVFEYTRYFHIPYLFAEDPDEIDRVLFIGGGGFTGPKRFEAEYDVTVDVVEIDPEVIDVAKEYFRVEESAQLNIYNADGRRFLRNTDNTYDVIVLDAYKKDKVPFQLTTVEFMRLANDRLSKDGIFFANVISAPNGPASEFYRAQYRTMEQVFPQVYGFPTARTGVVQNVELVATKNSEVVTESELRTRNRDRDIGIDLSSEIGSYRNDEPTEGVPILQDNRAPVDSLLDPMVGQRYVIEQAPPENETVG
ncbi:spermidine synthase [Halorussus salinisoli]|uniref:spermidine synthase n=1 Tax=Halorussus salinisoli TaxID=2558242 RepID=UPI0010C1BC87